MISADERKVDANDANLMSLLLFYQLMYMRTYIFVHVLVLSLCNSAYVLATVEMLQ